MAWTNHHFSVHSFFWTLATYFSFRGSFLSIGKYSPNGSKTQNIFTKPHPYRMPDAFFYWNGSKLPPFNQRYTIRNVTCVLRSTFWEFQNLWPLVGIVKRDPFKWLLVTYNWRGIKWLLRFGRWRFLLLENYAPVWMFPAFYWGYHLFAYSKKLFFVGWCYSNI